MIFFQRKFTLDLLHEFDYLYLSPVSLPFDSYVKLLENHGISMIDPTLYWHLLNNLNYLTHTTPYSSFTVQYPNQYMQDPRDSHLEDALRSSLFAQRS